MRGALRTSRTRGGMRWTQKARETHAPDAYGEVAWFGRRGAGAKLAIRSAGDGGKRAVLREEREVSRKAIAQGRPGCSCRTCMLVCAFAMCIGTRDRGCGVHPVFPAPSSNGGQRNVQTSGERCREIAKACPRHCKRSDAIHVSPCGVDGLLRFRLIAYWVIFSFQLHLPNRCCCLGASPHSVVWQPAHTLALKRIAARERAALFTDLPQMRVEH